MFFLLTERIKFDIIFQQKYREIWKLATFLYFRHSTGNGNKATIPADFDWFDYKS